MRHRKHFRKLNRTPAHRGALLRNMAISLVTHEQISTTLPKAKALRPYVEKLVTLARKADLARRRLLLARLRNVVAVEKLCVVLGSRYAKRPGGYTRIIKLNRRYGDHAPMAVIEFVDRDMDAKGKEDLERIVATREKETPSDTSQKA